MIKHPILFFDGICVMCNRLMSFALKIDKNKRFRFATLQGETAKSLIPQYADGQLNTVVLLEQQRVYTESDAIIKLLADMGGVFVLIKILRLIPKALRDMLYRYVAKRRYVWFGQTEGCILLSKDEQKRVLP